MKLRTKASLGVAVVFSVLTLVLGGLVGTTLMHGFQRIDAMDAEDEAGRAGRMLRAEAEGLMRSARDYAEWDESVRFIFGESPEYPAENWTVSSLSNIQMDAVMIFDADRRVVGAARIDGEELVEVPPEWADRVRDSVRAVLADAGGQVRRSGLVRWQDDRLAVIACAPVMRTDRTGGVKGAFVALRWADGRMLDRVRDVIGSPVSFEVFNSPEAVARAADRRLIEFEAIDANRAQVRLLLRDHAGSPVGALRIERPRPIMREGWSALGVMVAQYGLVALIVGLLLNVALRGVIIARLERMRNELQALARSGDLKKRVGVEHSDEIAELGAGINAMLDSLERGARDRERARQEREHLQQQLINAQRNEAIGEFAGGIAHDFNNCLTSASGWIRVAMDTLPPADPVQNDLQMALKSTDHAAAVVRQLVTYSRQGAFVLAPLRINDVISESFGLLRAALPKTIELRLHMAGVEEHVLADRTQLQQVLMNIVGNARDAMDGKGLLTIDVKTASRPTADRPGAAGLAPCDYVHLTIEDTGPGIPPAVMARLFEPFFTTKPTGKGTGLGLAVVRSVMERHHGGVGVENVAGGGARFHLYLPVHRASAAAATGAIARGRGGKVLIAEDDEAIGHLLSSVLKRHGWEVTVAPDGEAAWQVFTARTDFDVVLTDLMMPRLGGLQLGERIFNTGRRTPVVLMTAFGSTLDEDQMRESGFAAVLAKPMSPESVLETLSRIRP